MPTPLHGILLTDAHNHLHDTAFDQLRSHIIKECEASGFVGAVVNGTKRGDWDQVLTLAHTTSWIVPSVGFHPWFLDELPSDWRAELANFLDAHRCAVGEIGMDLRNGESEKPLQENVFRGQVEIAKARNLPFSLHSGRSWGLLHDILRTMAPFPAGFLLHSFTGSRELMKSFVSMGGYVSCPAALLSEARRSTFEVFRDVPSDRLLVESDAPFQPAPPELDTHHLKDPLTGERLSHPTIVAAIVRRLAEQRGVPVRELGASIAENFERLFGALRRS